jgi:hypothetical protein
MATHRFTIYLTSDGTITRSGFSNVAAQPLGPGEALLAGVTGNPKTQQVDITATPPTLIDLDED